MKVERLDNFFKSLARLAFFGLLVFEVLNWAGILHFELDFTWLGLVVTSAGAWLGLEIIAWRLKRVTGQGLRGWAYLFAFAMVFIDAYGDFNYFYTKFGWYDNMGHFIGGLAAGIVMIAVYNQLAKTGKIAMGKWGRFISALGVATMLGVFFELEEYLEDYFTGSQRLGDGFDTANDLLLDFIGSFIVCFFGVIFSKIKRNLKLF